MLIQFDNLKSSFKRIRSGMRGSIFLLASMMLLSTSLFGQVQISGDITAHMDSVINLAIGDTPQDLYAAPSAAQETTWRGIIQDILDGDYVSAHSGAGTLDYRVVEFTDVSSKVFYILERTPSATSNFWGTFVFNPEPRRPNLVIQCPHPVQNLNTGNQGFRVFTVANALAFFVAGTHKCNTTTFSPCSGTSTSCSVDPESYRSCDQAHIVNGTFQFTTEELLDYDSELIFIQPHGYTPETGEPDIVISNGTKFYPAVDYLPDLRDNLYNIDNSLTFKIAHIDDWGNDIGQTNVQGRLINNTGDPCADNATSTTGQFIHLEQKYAGLRDTENNWYKLANAIVLTFPLENGQVTSAQSGSWNDNATWEGGQIPTSDDDVLIAAGHTITVDDLTAECHSVLFGDTSSHIDMDASSRLSVYGDFTLFNELHNVFSAGWSATDAKIYFTGFEPLQTLSGWSTTGGSTSFRDVVIDKSSGKVVTGGTGMRLGVQNSLEVLSGTLELSADDDLEARWASSGLLTGNQNLTIDITADGHFLLFDGDGTHFIRSDTGSVPIGKMTVYGEVQLYDASSYDININNVDVKSGGILELGTGLGSTTYGPEFNPGTITVESGGEILNQSSTDIWFDTSSVILNTGATYKTASSTTIYPPTFVNNGKVRYQRDPAVETNDQIVVDTNYYDIELSFNGNGTKKAWSFLGDRSVNDSLTINNDAELLLTADDEQTLTVNNTIRLTSGSIDNSDPDITLAVGDGALISRATGTLAEAPTFMGGVDVRYTSTTASVTTGPELPTSSSALNSLTIYSTDQTVTLGSDIVVNETLTLSTGTFDNDGVDDDFSMTMAEGSTVRRAAAELTTAPIFDNSVNVEYISNYYHVSTGYEIPTASGILKDFTISGDHGVTLSHNMTVNRTMTISGSALNTESYTVTLASGVSLVEENGFTVRGNLTTTRTLSQSVNNNLGGIGVEINATGGAPGATTVLRVTDDPPSIGSVQGISRYFDITPANNSGLNATMVFHYSESELNGIMENTLTLYSSTDGGATWTPRGGTRDETANTLTLSGISSFSRWTAGGSLGEQLVSVQSGSWTDPATWQGEVIPGAEDDVMILAGHTISVDDNLAQCHSLSFGGNDALIDMNAFSRLDIYGDFTLFDRTHNVFSAGWSADSAFVRFVGSEPTQTLANFSTTGASTSFRDLIIEKDSGTVVTTLGDSLRLGIQNSLEIISGTLELAPGADLEARWASSGNLTGNQDLNIMIHPGGKFILVDGDGTHFIRSGAGSLPVGKMTIYGEAEFYDASSYDISIGGIDVKDGGTLKLGTNLGSSTYGPEFNPGTITIDSGGSMYGVTTTNIWFDTTIVILNRGGTYKTSSSTTVFPPTFINNGKVRYQRDPETETTDQVIVDTNYYDIEFSFNGNDTKKIWTLADDRTVDDSMTINNDAEFILEATSPYTVTVNGLLRLTSGLINNSDADATLVLADGVWISRATGQISNTPNFLGNINVRYTSTETSVTTGPELPTGSTVLNDLTIYSTDQTVTLGANATVNNELTLSTGVFDNNGSADNLTLTLADGSTIRRATGELTAAPVFADQVDVEYISTVGAVTTGPELPFSPTVLNDLTISGNMGVTLGADVTVNGTLALNDSILSTGTYTATLGNSAGIIETSGYVVQGKVATTRTLNQAVNESFGGLGIEINASGGAPGATAVLRTAGTAPTISGATGVSRYFDVTPTNNSGLNATVKLHYHESELNGAAENTLAAYSSSNGGTSWTSLGGTVDTAANTVTVDGIGSFDRLGLGGTSAGCDCNPGEANNSGSINILDATYIINYLYKSGPAPKPYAKCSGDANCNCAVNILDATFLINYLYKSGPAPCDCATWSGSCGTPQK
nr:hypothetical protein [candidate division Zixibacteria bacterium]